MAIGLGRILGFTFPENFNQPFRAQSITEFWRRWHITLFRWFRDYLFIPLGRHALWHQELSGADSASFILLWPWHGPTWNYVVWGAYQGILLSVERFFTINYGRTPRGSLAMLVTFILTLFGFAVIRCEDMAGAWQYLSVMLGLHTPPTEVQHLFSYLQSDKLPVYVLAIFFSWVPGERLKLDMTGGRMLAAKYGIGFVIMLLSVITLSASSFNPFIYFKF